MKHHRGECLRSQSSKLQSQPSSFNVIYRSRKMEKECKKKKKCFNFFFLRNCVQKKRRLSYISPAKNLEGKILGRGVKKIYEILQDICENLEGWPKNFKKCHFLALFSHFWQKVCSGGSRLSTPLPYPSPLMESCLEIMYLSLFVKMKGFSKRNEFSSVQKHLSAYPHTQLSIFRNNTQCTVFNIHEKNDNAITRKIIINFDQLYVTVKQLKLQIFIQL